MKGGREAQRMSVWGASPLGVSVGVSCGGIVTWVPGLLPRPVLRARESEGDRVPGPVSGPERSKGGRGWALALGSCPWEDGQCPLPTRGLHSPGCWGGGGSSARSEKGSEPQNRPGTRSGMQEAANGGALSHRCFFLLPSL